MLYQILYISELNPARQPNVFAAICREARANNASLGVHGALLFDGHRFAQWLQGPEAGIRELMSRIEYDERHINLQMLAFKELPSQAFQGWRNGFLAPELLDELLALPPDAAARIDAFIALLTVADLDR
jgi:hypothetical protein